MVGSSLASMTKIAVAKVQIARFRSSHLAKAECTQTFGVLGKLFFSFSSLPTGVINIAFIDSRAGLVAILCTD